MFISVLKACHIQKALMPLLIIWLISWFCTSCLMYTYMGIYRCIAFETTQCLKLPYMYSIFFKWHWNSDLLQSKTQRLFFHPQCSAAISIFCDAFQKSNYCFRQQSENPDTHVIFIFINLLHILNLLSLPCIPKSFYYHHIILQNSCFDRNIAFTFSYKSATKLKLEFTILISTL